jgi:DMSO/TMAO reductase YedYZ heme-binding membrane subunit
MDKNRKIVTGIWAAGSLLFLVLYGYIAYYQSKNSSQGALGMPSMHMNHMLKFWSFPILQASGLVGLIVAWFSIFFGLHQSSRVINWIKLDAPTNDVVHRNLSLLTLGLVVVHVVATAFDAMGDSWRTVLWFNGWATAWPQASWAYNIGILGFYLILLLGPTYYLRKRIGIQRWKFVHRFVLVFYILSVWHALILGLDVGGYPWIRPVLWALQIPLLLLVAQRFVEIGKKRAGNPVAKSFAYFGVFVTGIGIFAVGALLVTGNWGFISVQ